MVRRTGFFLPCLIAIFVLSGCGVSLGNPFTKPTVTPQPIYSLPGGGPCVSLGDLPKPPTSNIHVSNDTFKAHSEPMVVMNPHNPLNLVGGSKFFSDPATYSFKIGYYSSFDGGCTWADGGVLPGFDATPVTSDISFAFGLHNEVYAAVLDTDDKKQSGVSVSVSHDGGKIFGLPVHAYQNTDGSIFSDKPWIAVDPKDGSLVVVWSFDHQESLCTDPAAVNACPQELGFTRSVDGGLTWSPVRQVEGTASFCTNPAQGRPTTSHQCDAVLGAIPAFLPDGTLTVAFAYVDLGGFSDADRGGAAGPKAAQIATKMVVIVSPDGGTTWNRPVQVATIHDVQSPFKGLKFRNFSLPAYAADPKTGQLYLAWADSANDQSDILIATSTDRGQTWSTPLRVNDDSRGNGVLQFQPQLAIAPNGVLSVTFFDTRTDPAHKLIDVFLAQSVDHGATFLPNQRITTASWDSAIGAPRDFNGQEFIGDYQGLAAGNAFVYPFWNDTRTGSQEIFTMAVPSAQPGK